MLGKSSQNEYDFIYSSESGVPEIFLFSTWKATFRKVYSIKTLVEMKITLY